MYGVIILAILIVLLCTRRSNKKCSAKKVIVMREDDVEEAVGSLNDLEQDVFVRGAIPESNQPNHTANMWKCDFSHAAMIEGAGYLDNSFAVDYPTPLRPQYGRDLQGMINSHMLPRFASV